MGAVNPQVKRPKSTIEMLVNRIVLGCWGERGNDINGPDGRPLI